MAEAVNLVFEESDMYDFKEEFNSLEEFKEFNEGKNYKVNHNIVDILIAFAEETRSILPIEDYSMTLGATSMKL